MNLSFKSTIIRRFLSLLSAAAVAVSGFQVLAVPVFAETAGDLTITGDSGYSYDSNILTISEAGSYTISGTSTDNDRIVVNADSDDEVELTLSGVNISRSSYAPLSFEGGNLTLILEGDNYLTSTSDNYAALAKTSADNTLTITSCEGNGSTSGSLTAESGKAGAGIGGNNADSERNGSNITIAGGTVTAKATYGAAIGSGRYGSNSNITITGGNVNAEGTYGAGIGSAQATDNGCTSDGITITGGTVTASSTSGAGIGAGCCKGSDSISSNITIIGGFVTATSSTGAGIGAGENTESGSSNASGITITGGTVTASSTSGDGIGSGKTTDSNVSDIKIYNSSVKASSVPIIPVNADGESVYLYEFTDTTEGESITVDGETVIDSVVYHSDDDTSQYLYLPKDSASASYGGSYYTLSYSEEDGTTSLTKIEEDTIEIPNAAMLYVFAQLVNSGETTLNGTVTADIDFSGYSDMIGSESTPYAGTFDGGGYTITVDYDMATGADNAGLFSYIDGGTVQNLTVEGNIDFTNTTSAGSQTDGGYTNIGGVAGYITNGTISNVVSSVNITSPTYPLHSAGGIVGRLYESTTVDSCIYTGTLNAAKSWDALGGIAGYTYRYCKITNCANLGTLYATTGTNAPYLGGILGYVNNTNFYGIQSCYSYGSVSADDTTYCGAIVGWLKNSSNNLTNNCWLGTSAGKAYGANDQSRTEPDSSTADEFESGAVTYILNESTSGGTNWYQTIGTDAYPVLDSSHGIVYIAATVYCPNTFDVTGYNNTGDILTAAEGGSTDEHTYENYECIYCSIRETSEPTQASDGYYEIYTVPELYWFAEAVNANSEKSLSESDTNDTYNARLMADIDLDGLEWTPIGFTSTYNSNGSYAGYSYIGTFDGNGHVIKNMTVDADGKSHVGFFGATYDANIKNLGIVNGCVTNAYRYAGGIAGALRNYGTMTNCYFTGTVEGSSYYVAGLIPYVNRRAEVKNCYASATAVSSGTDYVSALFYAYTSGLSISNCYYDSSVYTAGSQGYGTGCSPEEFASGKVAYLLNESTSGGSPWYQNLDNGETVDSYPVLDSSHGTVYYFEDYYYCPDYKDTYYSNYESASGNPDTHTYENGVCIYCGSLDADVFTTDEEGRYIIPDAATLTAFAAAVNSGSTDMDGIVTADIDFTACTDMIGSSTYPYAGTFDGGGYTITVDYDMATGADNVGLFSYIDGGTVQNLTVEGDIDFTNTTSAGSQSDGGYTNIGGVVGYMDNGVISNVVSSVDITNTADYPLHSAGGIVGRLPDNSTVDKCLYTGKLTAYNSWDCLGGIAGYTYSSCQITNCANLGTLYATTGTNAPYLGGILGYVKNTNFNGIQNCYNYGSVSADDESYCGAIVGWLRTASTNITNNYWLNTSASKAFGTNGTSNTAPAANTAGEFESGSVTWLLNGSVEGDTWVQTIGTDSYPVFAASDSDCAKVVKLTSGDSTVYANVVSSGVELSISESVLSGIIIDTAVYGGEGGEYLNGVGVVIGDTLYQLENYYYVDSSGDYSEAATDRAFFPVTRASSSAETVTSVRGEAAASTTATADDSLLYFVTEADTSGLTIKDE